MQPFDTPQFRKHYLSTLRRFDWLLVVSLCMYSESHILESVFEQSKPSTSNAFRQDQHLWLGCHLRPEQGWILPDIEGHVQNEI